MRSAQASQDHGSGHPSPSTDDRAQQALLWALALNGTFLTIEATAGWLTNSLALWSDAAHMANDVGILAIALGAGWLARRLAKSRPDSRCQRIEIVGGLVSGTALLAAGGMILAETLARLNHGGPPVPGWPVLMVGAIGLLINLGSAWYLHRAGSDSLHMRGALLHMLADAAGSVGAVIAALLMMLGIREADAGVSLVIAALVTWASYSLLRDAAHALLQEVKPQAMQPVADLATTYAVMPTAPTSPTVPVNHPS